jgi:23S rRNA (cytosine1962-C5)-methyltransferase
MAAGTPVRILHEGEVIGHGLADPGSPIEVRAWGAPFSAALVTERAARAASIRRRLFEGQRTTAFRLIAGEGDRMPGLVVDIYGPYAVVRLDGGSLLPHRMLLANALEPIVKQFDVTAMSERESSRGEKPKFTAWFGDTLPEQVTVEEYGVPFVVDLQDGQKTGAFLDQRDNRRLVGTLARGKRVLNLFSYAGGFSLHAALGGATHVTSVDIASKGHATAQKSFVLAGVDPKLHAFVTADVFQFLDRAGARGDRWDLIVCDPPSFAPNEKAVATAITAYRKLHKGCAKVLARDGLLCAASCSSHVDAARFMSTLDDVSLDRSDLRLLQLNGPPVDHPTLPAWPEGRYLKFAILG